MGQITITTPEPTSLGADVLAPVIAEAQGFVVTTIESHAEAQTRGSRLRQFAKRMKEAFEPARKALDDAKKQTLAVRDSFMNPSEEAASIYFTKAADYTAEQERLAQERQRQIESEARAQEEERQLTDALMAEEAGEVELAESILASPVSIPFVHVEPAVARVKGVGQTIRWSAVVHDLPALILHVADEIRAGRMADVALLEASTTMLNRRATALRSDLSIPGVKAVATKYTTVRS